MKLSNAAGNFCDPGQLYHFEFYYQYPDGRAWARIRTRYHPTTNYQPHRVDLGPGPSDGANETARDTALDPSPLISRRGLLFGIMHIATLCTRRSVPPMTPDMIIATIRAAIMQVPRNCCERWATQAINNLIYHRIILPRPSNIRASAIMELIKSWANFRINQHALDQAFNIEACPACVLG